MLLHPSVRSLQPSGLSVIVDLENHASHILQLSSGCVKHKHKKPKLASPLGEEPPQATSFSPFSRTSRCVTQTDYQNIA